MSPILLLLLSPSWCPHPKLSNPAFRLRHCCGRSPKHPMARCRWKNTGKPKLDCFNRLRLAFGTLAKHPSSILNAEQHCTAQGDRKARTPYYKLVTSASSSRCAGMAIRQVSARKPGQSSHLPPVRRQVVMHQLPKVGFVLGRGNSSCKTNSRAGISTDWPYQNRRLKRSQPSGLSVTL